ncbi:MAG: hypothetical protein ACREMH_01080 [Gemmatimonadales bacterium]
MPRPVVLLTLTLAGLAACQDEAPPVPPSVAAAFPELPLPPNPSYVSRGGGADALTIRLRSAAPYDLVRGYYLGIFKAAPWALRNEAKDPSGGTVLYAERAGRPIWVRLRPDGDSHTHVELTGAAAKPGPRAGSAEPADTPPADSAAH